MRIRTCSWLAVGLTAALVTAGCGGSKKRAAPTIPPTSREMPSEADENQPDPNLPEAIPPLLPPDSPEPPSEEQTRYGYRVQVGAFADGGQARSRADELRQRFTERVYVVHEGLLYKVQIGDFVSRDRADAARRKAIDLGLSGAFVVDAMIREP